MIRIKGRYEALLIINIDKEYEDADRRVEEHGGGKGRYRGDTPDDGNRRASRQDGGLARKEQG